MPHPFRAGVGGSSARSAIKRGSLHAATSAQPEQRRLSSEFASVHVAAPLLAPSTSVSSSSCGSQRSARTVRVSASAFSGLNRRRVQSLRLETMQESCSTFFSDTSTDQGPDSPGPSSGRSVITNAVAAAAPATAIMKTVTVELGDRSYPIYIGTDLLSHGELLRKHVLGKRVLIVTNTTIAPLYLEKCKKALTEGGKLQVDSVILPDGEEHKSMEVLQQVWDKALECRMDRGTTFLALGGGVIGDMTGFAAACYQRGVHFIQVPTTVMSQVDSSVGGKTGVNHPLGKNMIGAFYQPVVVLVDTSTLSTLPDRELASGISEVIKYGLIRDAPFFEWLESNVDRMLARDTEAIAYAIERSCINKAEVVAADEREAGLRATLNLGHTFGHAIETGSGYGTYLHGEAVSIGTVMAADMSLRLGWIDQSLYDRTLALLQRCRLPTRPPAGMTAQQFKDLMAVDKKVSAGKMRLILLKGSLGNCVFTGDFDASKLDDTLAAFCS